MSATPFRGGGRVLTGAAAVAVAGLGLPYGPGTSVARP